MEKEHPFYIELAKNLDAIWTSIMTLVQNDTLRPEVVKGAQESAFNATKNILDEAEKLVLAPAPMEPQAIELTPEMEVSAKEPAPERESRAEQQSEPFSESAEPWQGQGWPKKKKK